MKMARGSTKQRKGTTTGVEAATIIIFQIQLKIISVPLYNMMEKKINKYLVTLAAISWL